MLRRTLSLAAALTAAMALHLPAQEAPRQTRPRTAGPTQTGYLLPNGWSITPAGDQVALTDLPLNIVALPDSRHALVASSGYNAHELVLVDLQTMSRRSTATVRESWFGLAWEPRGGRVWWSGGGGGILHTYRVDLEAGELSRLGDPEPDRSKLTRAQRAADPHFRSGLTLADGSTRLYTLDIGEGVLHALPLAGEHSAKSARLGGRPYDVAIARDGNSLYVSDWAGKAVIVLDPESLLVRTRIAVGEHPNQIAVGPRDGRVFVACASSNSVVVIDPAKQAVTETISTSLFPRAPEGSTPDALVIAPDGETLYVANADNNCVAVVDIEAANRSQVKGFIPTGWYPTAVAVTPDGRRLLVGVGKGNQTKANPLSDRDDDQSRRTGRRFPYIGTTLSGALSIVEVPDEKQLAAYTEAVYRNCPYSDTLLASVPSDRKTAIPTKVGDPSPIKYVLYIIKENRTYDQVLGDMERGNGDPSLVMFGEEVTPNHHKLAREFVLLDNLYCNGHVSADGHPWSTMAYNTDYIARNWALTYSGRDGIDDDDEGDLSKAPSGYLWDSCKAAGLTYRSYGEYGRRVSQPDGSFRMEGRVPGLVGHFCPDWGVPSHKGQEVRDTDRVETFLREFREFERNGEPPRFMVMSLGEDHTSGTTPGAFTPRACVASNDLALGRLIAVVSRSKFWPETAIFVIEDDAQNGPDHVDAHRTVGLVISPYTRRKTLDSTHYQTVSMIRTMELILGLPPLSQYDAAANPMFASFTDQADLTPYSYEPARIDLNVRNSPLAYGAERSARMDFSEYDKIDDFELNEILWKSIKGADAPVPPPVRRAIAYRPFGAP
jgi:YVTN family beta-propeller protein